MMSIELRFPFADDAGFTYDSDWYWCNGSEWVVSDETYSQSNTASDTELFPMKAQRDSGSWKNKRSIIMKCRQCRHGVVQKVADGTTEGTERVFCRMIGKWICQRGAMVVQECDAFSGRKAPGMEYKGN
jgi:hypothetical protein